MNPPNSSPFDLKRALAGDPLITRDNQILNGLKDSRDGSEFPYLNGKLWYNSKGKHYDDKKYDLFMKEQTLKERLLVAAILTTSEKEYYTLKGLYLGSNIEPYYMADSHRNKGYYWSVNGACLKSLIPNFYVVYASLQDFLVNKPEQEITLPLNSKYTAVISKDKVKVGDQEFSHNVILQLAEKVKQLQ